MEKEGPRHLILSSLQKFLSLPRSVSAIDSQISARHETAGVAEEEDGSAAVLVGRAEPAEHVLLGPLLSSLGVLDEEVLEHLGEDVAGGEGVDADAVDAPF